MQVGDFAGEGGGVEGRVDGLEDADGDGGVLFDETGDVFGAAGLVVEEFDEADGDLGQGGQVVG